MRWIAPVVNPALRDCRVAGLGRFGYATPSARTPARHPTQPAARKRLMPNATNQVKHFHKWRGRFIGTFFIHLFIAFLWISETAAMQASAIFFSVVTWTVLAVMAIAERRRKIFAVLIMVDIAFGAYGSFAYGGLERQLNEYVLTFRQEHSCAPDIDDLLKSHTGWRRTSPNSNMALKSFAVWGAMRTMVYRGYGDVQDSTLSYGGFDDAGRTVSFPVCGVETEHVQ